jgi:hypothetical protein
VRTLLFAIGVLTLVGCKGVGLRPVGPLAPLAKDPAIQKGQPLPSAPAEPTASARPPAIKPTPPTMLVTPGEVTADNANVLAQKLSTELSTDSKATANLPVTAEISKVGRMKP